MDEQQKAKLDQMNKLRRGAAIIEGTQDKFRQDGYTNLLNKYGTAQDNSTACIDRHQCGYYQPIPRNL